MHELNRGQGGELLGCGRGVSFQGTAGVRAVRARVREREQTSPCKILQIVVKYIFQVSFIRVYMMRGE